MYCKWGKDQIQLVQCSGINAELKFHDGTKILSDTGSENFRRNIGHKTIQKRPKNTHQNENDKCLHQKNLGKMPVKASKLVDI